VLRIEPAFGGIEAAKVIHHLELFDCNDKESAEYLTTPKTARPDYACLTNCIHGADIGKSFDSNRM